MGISAKQVDAALEYLVIDPHPSVVAEYELEKAIKHRKDEYAKCYLQSSGTVGERESTAQLAPAYSDACDKETEARLESRRHEKKVEDCKTIISLYQTVSKNVRATEQLR